MSDSSSYLLRLHHPTQTGFPSADKHPSVPAEPGAVRGGETAYVSTSRILDWLATVKPAAPDGRHFLRQQCNNAEVAETASRTMVPPSILFPTNDLAQYEM